MTSNLSRPTRGGPGQNLRILLPAAASGSPKTDPKIHIFQKMGSPKPPMGADRSGSTLCGRPLLRNLCVSRSMFQTLLKDVLPDCYGEVDQNL